MANGDDRKLAWEKQRFLLGAAGATAFFVIGLWQFNLTSRNDFAKPLLLKQLDLCIQASGAAATLADDLRKSADPTKNAVATEFLSLYYGKLAVVEDRCVYRAMFNFKTRVLDSQDVRAEPHRLAIAIGFACRRMLSKSWNAGLLSIYDPQRLLESFNDLVDYRDTMNSIEECR